MSDSSISQEVDGQSKARERRDKKFYVIRDNFQTLHDVSKAMIEADVHDSELIFGIDYTISNKTQGKTTFGGLSLHDTSGQNMNPYQQVICILGETLEVLDKDGRIPAFCLGDSLFPLKPEGPCNGFNEVLDVYKKVTMEKDLSSTLDIVPVIEEAVKLVKETRRYHILVIVTCGKIEKENLKPTQDAIVEASKWPLSIVVIGVGDGPWETMMTFDDGLPERVFDNFQFVDFQDTIEGAKNSYAAFALRALMEIPDQYNLIKDHELFGLKQSDSHVDHEKDGETNARTQREKRFYVIKDNYKTLHDVTKAMADADIQDCELIFGIDYTKSNKSQGQKTFGGLSLHDTSGPNFNPYQQVICILGEALEVLDKDGRIPAFCLGDSLFPLKPEGPCNGFNEVLDVYKKVTVEKDLSSTLDFVPVIEEAVKLVKETRRYHILVIVTCGKIEMEDLKPTQDAIVEASKWPLSIVVIGVGDGPWETMMTFDDGLPERVFDNFQFVDFQDTIEGAKNSYAAFALRALMEIPEQYNLIKDHELFGLKQSDSHVDHEKDGETNARTQREKRFYVIKDNYKTLHDVTKAMADADIQDCELIFGIDYTKSNKSQGQKTFGGLSLHDTSGPNFNPYQQVICILGETFETLDDDGWIPAFCFCDTLFPLKSEGPCKGFNEVLDRYIQVTKEKEPSGSADFVPVIEQAVKIVKETKKYHILVIITDGKIVNMKTTNDAIVEASKWPLSIVVIGVGDGPWEDMMKLDDELPEREFDNFQFVDFHKILKAESNTYAAVALGALMEIPEQYQIIKHHELLRKN
ncbi:hypothetical protein CHS0354_007542 [Potamilus streckersoni]|uniref:VWFA domain-containing protein n=1 Tax=Potamilus streckersoni TaxID=2493646 RepID=A0AAE0RM92_9BIVA|nr:hypothetical protein CHS0354_007542 [Potamilus streckersoni]